MNEDIIVIGAGASGLLAAITAARNEKKVLIIEKNDKPGRKLLATGNGRCNLTNQNQEITNYHSNNMSFVNNILNQFSKDDTISFFREIGLLCKDKNGYIYPKSMQSQSVVDALLSECQKYGVKFLFHCEVIDFQKKSKDFLIICQQKEVINKKNKWIVKSIYQEKILAKKVIVACGGKANEKLGATGFGYKLASKMGHTIITPLPALCGLIANKDSKSNKYKVFFQNVSGVRCEIKAQLMINHSEIMTQFGELQLTEYGLSGIVIFQLSRYVSKALENNDLCEVIIDFLPDLSEDDILNYITIMMSQNKTKPIKSVLGGFMNQKLSNALLQFHNLYENITYDSDFEKNKDSFIQFIHSIKNFSVPIIATNDFEKAQVCTGGINLNELNTTMESKISHGLYFCGELLDVDGFCGGYNLQWAWSSGYVAGRSISID